MRLISRLWREWSKSEGLSYVCGRVQDRMYAQKFEGAAAGIFSPSIIARELGLADSQRLEHEVKGNTLLAAIEKANKRVAEAGYNAPSSVGPSASGRC